MYLSPKQRDAYKKLYGERAEEQIRNEIRRRVILSAFVIAFTLISALVVTIRQSEQKELLNGYYIRRNETGETDKTVHLTASLDGDEHALTLNVVSRTYSGEEIEKMLPGFRDQLEQTIFPEGQQAEHVSDDLNLVQELTGYPFQIRWQSTKPLLLTTSGRIKDDELKKLLEETGESGIMVNLTAGVTYEDFSEELQYTVKIYPRNRNEAEALWELAEAEVNLRNAASEQEYLALPKAVGSYVLSYREEKAVPAVGLILCGVILALFIYIRDDEKLIKRAAEKDEELKREYPQLISRLMLYLRAGLTLKNTWHRICEDYSERKKYSGVEPVYEEMVKQDRKMQAGIGEVEAYRAFGDGLGQVRYKSLVSLLIQSLKTGNTQIRAQLERLMTEAFAEQKREAKVLGEKAGTKLLGPMFVMLIVVLVMILVPAAMSFAM